MRALFDKATARSRWSMSSSVLRSFTEYFGSNTEQLDIYSEAGRVSFTSYTEKIMDGKGMLDKSCRLIIDADGIEVLKQPLQTSVTIETGDFEDFSVQEKLHIGISVKDFRAIVTHADTLKTQITTLYSHPTRPMQLSYQERGILCEFTLMTIGDYRGTSATPTPGVSRSSSAAPVARPTPAQPSNQAHVQVRPNNMPPPTQPASRSFLREPASQRTQRPSPPPPKASLDRESLFLPAEDDDDRVWGEKNYDEDEDHIGWDASADNVDNHKQCNRHSMTNLFTQDALPRSFAGSRAGGPSQQASRLLGSVHNDIDRRIAPTQRISEVRRCFLFLSPYALTPDGKIDSGYLRRMMQEMLSKLQVLW